MTSAAASAFRAACRASDAASADVCWTSTVTSNGRPDVDVQEALWEDGWALFCAFWERSDDGGATGTEMAAGRTGGSTTTPDLGPGCALEIGFRSPGDWSGEGGGTGGFC